MSSPAYGYVHRGRVLKLGAAEGTYVVEVASLAPGHAYGPIQSAVRGLVAGDRVLLIQVGMTRGDLVIIGRLPERAPDITLPIEMADVTGLVAALDNRATDAELAALESATNLNFLVVNDKNDEQDGRLDAHDTDIAALEAADTALDGRLDTAESTLTTHTGQINTLTTYAQVFQAGHEFDMYGDLYSSLPRSLIAGFRTLVGQTALFWRSRTRVGALVNRLRVVCTQAGAGAGGLCTVGFYTAGSASGPYTLAGSATNAMSGVGTQAFVLASGVVVNPGTYILVLFLPNASYTTAPRIGSTQAVVSPASAINPGAIVWGSKAAVASPPASITVTDGTWTSDNLPWWVAAAN